MSEPAGGEPTRVFALRHGETDWNAELRLQGQLDVPLNANGRRQAERLAEALADAGIEVLIASDLARARETAAPLAARLGLPVELDPGLRERGFGVFEGLTHAEIEARWPEQALRWRRREPGDGPAGGEALEAFHARCIASATAQAVRHAGRTIALFAHGGVLDCLYRAAVGVDLQAPRSWQLGNAAVNRLLWHGSGFSLVGWNDTAHLDEPEVAPRPVADAG